MVLFIPCKLMCLCSTLPACTGPGCEPSNTNALIALNPKCKISEIIRLLILSYMQDSHIPQSNLVIHMLFSLSSVAHSSFQTRVPSNINLLCIQVFTYTLSTRRPALFEFAREVDFWRTSRVLLLRYLIQVFVLKLSSKASLVSQCNNPNALPFSTSFLLQISECLGDMVNNTYVALEVSLFLI